MAPTSAKPEKADPAPAAGSKKDKQAKSDKPVPDVEELNEEDQKLKEELDMVVERLMEDNASLYPTSLEHLKQAISSSTSSMTAVPKPLKFLRPHFGTLESVYERWPMGKNKTALADILSVIAMTAPGRAAGRNDTLKYRLLAGTDEAMIAQWGHEYVRHLALEIGDEFHSRLEDDSSTSDLLDLAVKIVPFFLKHNAEADAVDLLLEVESIESIAKFVDNNTYVRACRYLVSCVPFLPPGDEQASLRTAYHIYKEFNELPQALTVAIRLDEEQLVHGVFDAAKDESVKKQLAFIMGRQRQFFEAQGDDEFRDALSNVKLSEYYQYLIKELNLTEPKVPQDIYKSHLDTTLLGTTSLDPAKQNLASVFVNAFVNAGYGPDKLIQTDSDESSWIYKTKGPGMQAAAASIGLLNLWDFINGSSPLDKYMYSSEEQIKAGSLLGVGIVNSGVHDESDPALAVLSEYVENPSVPLRTAAIIGLGLAYAGNPREDLAELLVPIVWNDDLSMEVSSLAALSLGLIFVGTANGDVTSAIMQAFLERDPIQLSDKWTRFMALGLGLLYVGKVEEIEEIIETIKAIDHPVATIVETIVSICSYAGTGNVLQIQKLLREAATRPYEDEIDSDDESDAEEEISIPADEAVPNVEGETSTVANPPAGNSQVVPDLATDAGDTAMADADADAAETPTHPEDEDKEVRREARHESMKVKAYSVLGIAVIAMGDEIGQEMVMRHFEHLMHYGDAHIRRAVPLAMAIVSASDPQMKVYDTLSRYSHDSDLEVAINAIFAMGLVGAGTNNARLAQLLRQLAAYYSRDPDTLFMVRIAQGLIHLGKGVLTVNPFNSDRQILSPVALSGLLIVSLALLTPKSFILSENPQMLYYLTLSIQPRMLVTVNESLEPIKVSVRVGQAVDVVGQAGRPKTITGWVTHTTPVLLAVGERVELEDDEYIPLSSSLEGIVVLRKNPDSTVASN